MAGRPLAFSCGLRRFDTELHRVFFGRSDEIAALAAPLRSPADVANSRMLLVVGPSGCGKSSLVRAGLLPVMALEAGWRTLPPLVRGVDPVAALARELAHAARMLQLDWTFSVVRNRLNQDDGLAVPSDELLLAGDARQLLVAGGSGRGAAHLSHGVGTGPVARLFVTSASWCCAGGGYGSG
jgi:hypothetical protein